MPRFDGERGDGKLRDELLNGEVFNTLAEAKVLTMGSTSNTKPCARTRRCATDRARQRYSCRYLHRPT